MPVKGRQILKALRELVAPSTPQEIAQHLAKKRKRQPDLIKLEQEVAETLSGGTTFGFLEMCNGHYYNLDDTKKQVKLIEKEDNKKKKLPPKLVLTDSDNSDDTITTISRLSKKRKLHAFLADRDQYLVEEQPSSSLPKKRKRMYSDQSTDEEQLTCSPQKKRKGMFRDQSFIKKKSHCSPPKKRKSMFRDQSVENKNSTHSPSKKNQRQKISTTLDQTISPVTAQGAHSTPSNNLKCVASNENKSICSDDAKQNLALGAEIAKSKIDVIIDQIAASYSLFNAPSSNFSKNQQTSEILMQNVENPIATAANKTAINNVETDYKKAVVFAKCKLDEIVDGIWLYVKPQNIGVNSSSKWLQSDSSSASSACSTDSSQSFNDEIPSKISVQNYFKEYNSKQFIATHGSRDRASKYETPRGRTLVEYLESINVYGGKVVESSAQNTFFSNSLLLEDEGELSLEPNDSLLKDGQVNLEKELNVEVSEDYMSLPASEPTGVQITNPFRQSINEVKSEPEDINNLFNSNELCQRCWFEKKYCSCRGNY